jgi:[ribosomal protein S18]-alanine N-acetyltransferase
VRVRKAQPADIAAMFKLDHQSLSAAHWSEQQYKSLFNGPDGDSTYLAFVAEDETEVAASDQEKTPAGFLVGRCVDVECELQNIAVASGFRRRGIATLLVSELVGEARAHHAAEIFLEVRQSNAAARALYKKLGFEERGLRKGYYLNPAEDAILCCLRLY